MVFTNQQLVDVGILIGTDFNPDGIRGLGPKTALKLIKECGTIENALPPRIKNAQFPHPPQASFEMFFSTLTLLTVEVQWRDPDVEGVVDFMVRQKEFSEDRVRKALEKMQQGTQKQKGKTTLEKWFG